MCVKYHIFVEMLNHDDLKKKEAAVKCLEVMSGSDPLYWKSILNAGKIIQKNRVNIAIIFMYT